MKINESKAVKSVVMLRILESRGAFSYKRSKIKKFKVMNMVLINTGINISTLVPSLVSPQGIWL